MPSESKLHSFFALTKSKVLSCVSHSPDMAKESLISVPTSTVEHIPTPCIHPPAILLAPLLQVNLHLDIPQTSLQQACQPTLQYKPRPWKGLV